MILSKDENGNPFSDQTILANAKTMLLAGEDTTANSVAWAVHLMCDHEDTVSRVRGEADEVLGDADLPATLGDANRLSHAVAVAREAMRLRPVAPFLLLEATQDTQVGDLALDKGQVVCVLSRQAAISQQYFGTDATQFRPSRWHNATGAEEAQLQSIVLPFGTGPRICPGRSLALLEMRVLIALLYRNFDVERVGNAASVEENFGFVMSPKGLRVQLCERECRGTED